MSDDEKIAAEKKAKREELAVNEFQQRVKDNIHKLVNNYEHLISAAKVTDSTQTAREGLQVSVHAANMVIIILLELDAHTSHDIVILDGCCK